jgi:hypothetical protein
MSFPRQSAPPLVPDPEEPVHGVPDPETPAHEPPDPVVPDPDRPAPQVPDPFDPERRDPDFEPPPGPLPPIAPPGSRHQHAGAFWDYATSLANPRRTHWPHAHEWFS